MEKESLAENKSNVEFKGLQSNGEFLEGYAESLGDLKNFGIYFLTLNNISEIKDLPPISFDSNDSRYLNAVLYITCSSTYKKQNTNDRTGQVITFTDSEHSSPSTYSRLWIETKDGGEWRPWQLQVSGDISIVAPSNDLGEKISLLESNFTSEVSRAKEAETELGNKLIKLAGFGTISLGNTGVTGEGQYFVSTYNKKLYVSSKFVSPTAFVPTEVPYLDGAVYTYNNELYLYNGIEVVPVAKSLNEDVAEISRILGKLRIIEYEDNFFINVGLSSLNVGDVVDLNMQKAATFRCAVINVAEGDNFLLNVAGGSSGRAYAFLDSDNRLLVRADANLTLVDELLTAPENASKLILNDSKSGGFSYYSNSYIDLRNDVKKLKSAVDGIKSQLFQKSAYTQAYIDNMRMVWNADCAASYNTLEALTDKITGMRCEAIYTEPAEGETKFTTIALISNPNGIHNTKQYWADLNNKAKTHINIKSIHPVFTRNYCNFGIMHEGELFNIPYNGSTSIRYADMLPNVKYVYGWEIKDNGVNILLPDGNIVTLNNGEYTFTSNKGGVSASITLNINFNDYCGKYCCFEFFNNSDAENRIGCGQPQITKVQVTQSDGFNIYDNFIRPNGLLGITPAGFVWHQAAHEGYYSYK